MTYISICIYTVAKIRDVNPSLQLVVHLLREVIFNPHTLLSFQLFFPFKTFSPSKKLKIAFTEIKRKTCTETRQLSNEQPLWLPQSFFCKQRGKSFKVCCRHRTAGLGSLKSDLLHHYPHMRGNISQVIGTPFHIFVPSGPIDG